MESTQDVEQARATVRLFGGLLSEALDYEREAFDEDSDVEGADLCEWFSGWRERVKAELTTLGIYGPPESPRTPISAPSSTLDDLHNDHAALGVLLRLAEYGGTDGR